MRDSKQRDVVLSVVNNSHDHPSADTILYRCKEIMPSINIATVYRNLNALINSNKVLRIHTDNGDRFDKTLHAHAHFQCERCGAVVDVDGVDIDKIIKNGLDGVGKITKIDFILKGFCKKCKKGIEI